MAEDHGGHKEKEHKKHKKHHPHAHAEHEHEEGWIVSFADNVLLQMGFFVILLAMNIGPKGSSAEETAAQDRFNDFAIAMREAFHNPVDLGSTDPRDLPLIQRIRQRSNDNDPTETGEVGRDRNAQSIRPSDYTRAGLYLSFAGGSAELPPGEADKAEQWARAYAGTRWVVELRGHASSQETFRDPARGRRLAFDRAEAAGRALVAAGLDWRQLRLVSVGDADPVIPRALRPGEHASNQRVEVLVRDETVPDDPFALETGAD